MSLADGMAWENEFGTWEGKEKIMQDIYMVWRTDGHYWGWTEFSTIEAAVMYAQPDDIICKKVRVEIKEL